MLKNRPRFATMATLIFLAASVLTLAFSPPVRAAVLQFVGSYNGADIAIDPKTDSFVVSGDTSAVLKQEAAELFITNKDGSEAVAVIKPDTESVALGDLLARNPNFVMPSKLPQGYTADTDAIRFQYQGLPGLMVSWHNAAGERITFYRGEQPAGEVGTQETTYVVVNDLQGNPHAQLTWEADGYFYQIIATDESLTQSDLQSIVP